MSTQEIQEIREKYYGEATRYMDNAKEYLKNAKKDGDYYRDTKYVRSACGTAYSGLLIALDGFFILRGVQKRGKLRKAISYYQDNLGKIDRKMLDNLDVAYKVLHLSGYYDGINSVKVIKEGFDSAQRIVEKIKPTNGNV